MKNVIVSLLIVISIFIVVLSNPVINSLFSFFVNLLIPYSSLLNALITLLVGFAAFILYDKQKTDFKKDAANTVLLEIQNAERILKKLKEILKSQSGIPEDIFVMQQESWSKYRYLFVKDFERDDWDEISNFYFRCQKYDEAVTYNNTFFIKNEEQIRANAIRVVSDTIVQREDGIKTKDQSDKLIKYFKDNFIQEINIATYYPSKPINDAHRYVDDLNLNLTQSRVGIKLRRLAGIKE